MTIKRRSQNRKSLGNTVNFESYKTQVLAIVEKWTDTRLRKADNLLRDYNDTAWAERHKHPFIRRKSVHLIMDYLGIFPLGGWDGADLSKAINSLVTDGKLVKVKCKNEIHLYLPQYAPGTSQVA